jgi:hypothetical protein
MKTEDRRAAIAAYKERKTTAGIYAVRCAATGQAWVGQTPNLESIANRLWFTLRMGNNPCRSLQDAWTAGNGNGFTCDPLERIEEDTPFARDALLKARVAHWRAELGALSV